MTLTTAEQRTVCRELWLEWLPDVLAQIGSYEARPQLAAADQRRLVVLREIVAVNRPRLAAAAAS